MATKTAKPKTPAETTAPKLNLEAGQIIIFKNPQQDEGENRPDLYGFYKDAQGTDMVLSLWNSTSKKGLKYLSGKAKPEGETEATHNIALFVNDQKTADNKQPDFKGSISQGDTKQMEVALWRGHSKADGKFYINGTVKDLVHAQAFDFADKEAGDTEMPF